MEKYGKAGRAHMKIHILGVWARGIQKYMLMF